MHDLHMVAVRGRSRDAAALQTALRLVSTLTLPSLILQTVCKYARSRLNVTLRVDLSCLWLQWPSAVMAHLCQPCRSFDNVSIRGLLRMVRRGSAIASIHCHATKHKLVSRLYSRKRHKRERALLAGAHPIL